MKLWIPRLSESVGFQFHMFCQNKTHSIEKGFEEQMMPSKNNRNTTFASKKGRNRLRKAFQKIVFITKENPFGNCSMSLQDIKQEPELSGETKTGMMIRNAKQSEHISLSSEQKQIFEENNFKTRICVNKS